MAILLAEGGTMGVLNSFATISLGKSWGETVLCFHQCTADCYEQLLLINKCPFDAESMTAKSFTNPAALHRLPSQGIPPVSNQHHGVIKINEAGVSVLIIISGE